MDKPTLRHVAKHRRDGLGERDRRSALICERVLATPAYAHAQALHCYLPMRSEVDTHPLIQAALAQGKRVVVPVVMPRAVTLTHVWLESLDAEALEHGLFGTRNPRGGPPAAPGDWDLTIVPLLAFDRRGYRLGYGKGYYDRLLATHPTATIGVAFAIQEFDALPSETHDIALNWIVTEHETLSIPPHPRQP